MPIDEADVRNRCTEAVFERGETYRDEGRVRRLDRFDGSVSATVEGTHLYEITLDPSATDLDARCDCPYDGPGDCKHVVAVLLLLTEGLPDDDAELVGPALRGCSDDEVRAFLRDEFARDRWTRERFLARFGEGSGTSIDEFREAVGLLFERHATEDSRVRKAIDFSRFTDLAGQYCDRGRYREAATIYLSLAVGIDENVNAVDAATGHYVQAFASALESYVECVSKGDLEPTVVDQHSELLSERATTGADYLREYYTEARENLGQNGG